MKQKGFHVAIFLSVAATFFGLGSWLHSEIRINLPVQLEIGSPIVLPQKYVSRLLSGIYLMALPGGEILLGPGVNSIISKDLGVTWEVGPALPSGRILSLKNETFLLQDALARPVDGVGRFALRWKRFSSFEAMISGEEQSWSESPVRVARWTFLTADNDVQIRHLGMGQHLVELEDGTLLSATAGNFEGDTSPIVGFVPTSGQKWFKYRTYLIASNNGGSSWEYLSTVAYDGMTGQESFCEPALINLGGGELLVVMRTGRFSPMYQTRSLDGGRTWQKPMSTHVLGLSPQIVLLPSGILVCSFGWRPLKYQYSNGRKDERGPYPAAARDYQKRYLKDVGISDPSAAAGDYVMVSRDKGQTWDPPRQIAPPLTSGYTLLLATGQDTALVLSSRLTLPGKSLENVSRIWENKWSEWKEKVVILREVRQISLKQ